MPAVILDRAGRRAKRIDFGSPVMRPAPQDVDRHLLALRQSVAALRRHTGLSPRRLLFNPDRRRSVERGLQLYTRSLIELTGRIGPAAERNPAAYPSSIACLTAAGVLPSDLEERLRAFATPGGRARQGRDQARPQGNGQGAGRASGRLRRAGGSRRALARGAPPSVIVLPRIGQQVRETVRTPTRPVLRGPAPVPAVRPHHCLPRPFQVPRATAGTNASSPSGRNGSVHPCSALM